MNRIDELIALSTVGELTDAEEQELRAAAMADSRVAAAWREAQDTAADLHSISPVAPRPEVRTRILDAIADAPQLLPEPTQLSASATPIASIAPLPAPGPVTSLTDRRRRRVGVWMAAAAAALVLVAGVGTVVRSQFGTDRDVVAVVLDADDAVTRPLSGTLAGSLSVDYSADEGAIALTGTGLDALPDDRTLQLWLVSEEGATSVGIFEPDDDGAVRVRFDDVDPTDFVLGVTIEPAGGSASPTLPIVLSA
jgi:anti-sigma-K factor RskA